MEVHRFPGGRREATPELAIPWKNRLTWSVIRESDAIRVTNWIDRGRGSRRPPCCAAVARKASIVQPDGIDRHQARYEGELSGNFCPVVTVEPYQNFDEAPAANHNSNYGLQAACLPRDVKLLFPAYRPSWAVGAPDRRRYPLRSASTRCPYGGVEGLRPGAGKTALRDRGKCRS